MTTALGDHKRATRDKRLAWSRLAGMVMWLAVQAPFASSTLAADLDGSKSAPSTGAVSQVVSNCIDAAVKPASGASGAAAAIPSWAASSAAAADRLRRDEFDLRRVLLGVAGVLAIALTVATLWFAWHTVREARSDRGLRFTSHWGGFGGSSGGWQTTPSMAFLVVTAILALALVAVVACIVHAATPASAPPAVANK